MSLSGQLASIGCEAAGKLGLAVGYFLGDRIASPIETWPTGRAAGWMIGVILASALVAILSIVGLFVACSYRYA